METIGNLHLFIKTYSKISDVHWTMVIFLLRCHINKEKQKIPDDWQTKYSRVMTCYELWNTARKYGYGYGKKDYTKI